jgi:hypothetical protein
VVFFALAGIKQHHSEGRKDDHATKLSPEEEEERVVLAFDVVVVVVVVIRRMTIRLKWSITMGVLWKSNMNVFF